VAKVKRPAKIVTADDIRDHYCHCGKFGSFGRKGKVDESGYKSGTVWRCRKHRNESSSGSEIAADLFG